MQIPIREIVSPLAALVLFVLGASYFMTFATLYFKDAGSHTIGILQASYYAGMFLASCCCTLLIRRLGYVRSFALACSLAVGGVGLMGCCSNVAVWAVMRFLGGASMAVVYITVESWLLEIGTRDNRGKILAIYMVSVYAAQSIGQHFLDIVTDDVIIPFALTALLMSLAFFPVIGGAKRRNARSHDTGHVTVSSSASFFANIITLLRVAPFGISASLFCGIALASFSSFAPLFAIEYAIPVALLMSATSWGAVAFQWPMGWLSDKMDRQLLLTITSCVMVVASIAIIIGYPWAGVVLAFSFIWGGCAFTIYPQSIVVVVSQSPGTPIAMITAIQSAAYSIGSMLGPLIVPFFNAQWNTMGLYIFITGCSILFSCMGLTIFLWRRYRFGKSAPALLS